jgi:hypothetical protein
MTSFSELTPNIQKQAIRRAVSLNGPWTTVRSVPENRARVQSFAGGHYSGLHQLGVVFAHCGEQLGTGEHVRLGFCGETSTGRGTLDASWHQIKRRLESGAGGADATGRLGF